MKSSALFTVALALCAGCFWSGWKLCEQQKQKPTLNSHSITITHVDNGEVFQLVPYSVYVDGVLVNEKHDLDHNLPPYRVDFDNVRMMAVPLTKAGSKRHSDGQFRELKNVGTLRVNN